MSGGGMLKRWPQCILHKWKPTLRDKGQMLKYKHEIGQFRAGLWLECAFLVQSGQHDSHVKEKLHQPVAHIFDLIFLLYVWFSRSPYLNISFPYFTIISQKLNFLPASWKWKYHTFIYFESTKYFTKLRILNFKLSIIFTEFGLDIALH